MPRKWTIKDGRKPYHLMYFVAIAFLFFTFCAYICGHNAGYGLAVERVTDGRMIWP